MPDSIKRLTDLFAKFPTVGPRAAGRFVFYLISQPTDKVSELVKAIQDLKNNIRFCLFCFQPFESATPATLCHICQDTLRNKQLLCIVEKESDLFSIEATKRYKGLYFILGGVLGLRKNQNDLRLEELKERISNPQKFGMPNLVFTEIIIATNPTQEGKTTSILIERALKELPQLASMKITHLAKGLPVGGELEYADQETLESAFEGRK